MSPVLHLPGAREFDLFPSKTMCGAVSQNIRLVAERATCPECLERHKAHEARLIRAARAAKDLLIDALLEFADTPQERATLRRAKLELAEWDDDRWLHYHGVKR